ncbi:hypothetical protein [Endozoicomonas sp. 8E]|uniref:hypothetical protein n=1 Tax=Endozoicomonas sp. 8E TaxID=3035692 RepID=UPI0029394B35|nr:hypothetical protein [Endozoicomonas sp. 8E]WOG26214.1 hypothetical protein P6910_16810 [Endozoicomonas sp. 8E]
MSHGLTPTSAAANASSPPADSITSKPQSKLNPEAPTFIPRLQSAEQPLNSPSNIRDRQATASQEPSAQTFQQHSEKHHGAYSDVINDAYQELREHHFTTAEKAFRTIFKNFKKTLSQCERHSVLLGLARSLKEQTHEKQLEACSLLEELRSNERLTKSGASAITNLDLTLSLCEEALGRYLKAESRLLILSKKRPDANEQALYQPSGHYPVDIALARLWLNTNKRKLSETLLVKLAAELTQKLQSHLSASAACKFRKYLHDTNMTLVRLWQLMDKHQWAENLLLEMSGKHPNASEDILCRPCERSDINMTLVRHWEVMSKYKLAEKLLLNMSDKRPDATDDRLCKPTKHHDIDLALVRLWQLMGKHKLAEKLLLNMCGKDPDAIEDFLCKPTRHHDINLALVRLWQMMGKHKLAEKLLLNMSGKTPDASEEVLCRPCEHDDVNLPLVRHWEVMGKYKLAEKLLLNMSDKQPDASEELLCKISGKYAVDLALAILWQMMGHYERSEKLLLNMTGKPLDANAEALCKPSGDRKIDLALMRVWELTDGKHEWAERLMLNMSNKLPDASEEVLCKPSGNHEIDLALVRLWELIDGKHEWAERLLLNMSDKCPDASEEELCKPCGHHDIDLTLAHFWKAAGKRQRAKRLIKRCCELYHSIECELSLLNFHVGQAGFMEMITRYPKNADTLLTTSIHYFRLACTQIIEGGPESGKDNLKTALELVESALEMCPTIAGAVSQKAHCLRMMGASEQVWKALFARALSLEPSREHKDKTDHWRTAEAAAFRKVRDRAELK